MIAFSSWDVAYYAANVVLAVMVAAIVGLGCAACGVGFRDVRRARYRRGITRHPSSHVTVIRPPFDWADHEGSA